MSEKGELTATKVLKREEKATVAEEGEEKEQSNKRAAQAVIVRRKDGAERAWQRGGTGGFDVRPPQNQDFHRCLVTFYVITLFLRNKLKSIVFQN